jgi:hypothetical protein
MTEYTELLGPDALRDLRKKILAGYDPSDEEVGQVLSTLRAERAKIGTTKSKSSRAPRKALDLNALFDKPKEG